MGCFVGIICSMLTTRNNSISDLIFQLADEIGLDLNPVAYLSMAGWDEETGEQFSPTELLNTFFNVASVNVHDSSDDHSR